MVNSLGELDVLGVKLVSITEHFDETTELSMTMKHLAMLSLWVTACSSTPTSESVPAQDGGAVAKPADGPALVCDGPYQALLREWPLLSKSTRVQGVSSYDRGGGNDDGFTRTYSSLSVDPQGHHVLVDAAGPGRLNTLWFTSGVGGWDPLDLGRLRFYLDEEPEPRLVADANELFAGRVEGVAPSLVFNNVKSTGGFVSFVPVLFRKHLRVTAEKKPFFYSAQYDTLSGESVPSSEIGTCIGVGSDLPVLPPPIEKEVPLDHQVDGSGTVLRVAFEPEGTPSDGELHGARVRMTWDGESQPAVDVPLDMFFGSGQGAAHVDSLAFQMTPKRYENRFPMPFWAGFHLQVLGLRGRAYVAVAPSLYSQTTAGRLYAVHRVENPTVVGRPFTYMDGAGFGKLVGTVLAVTPEGARDKSWWEGDLRTWVDGLRSPSIQGTGHEDDFFGGWSNEFFSRPFSLPMHGEPKVTMVDRGQIYNAKVSLYRLWRGIPFLSSLRHTVEHGPRNEVTVPYESVTFYYAQGRSVVRDVDGLQVCDGASVQAHGMVVVDVEGREELASSFDGSPEAPPVSMCHRAHRGPIEFRMGVPFPAEGAYLRRTYDQMRGGQRAMVFVDGQEVGSWYRAASNSILRWGEDEFWIPGRFLAGKQQVQVRIVPAPTASPWDASEYRWRLVE